MSRNRERVMVIYHHERNETSIDLSPRMEVRTPVCTLAFPSIGERTAFEIGRLRVTLTGRRHRVTGIIAPNSGQAPSWAALFSEVGRRARSPEARGLPYSRKLRRTAARLEQQYANGNN